MMTHPIRRKIAKRNPLNRAAHLKHDCVVQFMLTFEDSKKLASIQGLCKKFGAKEKLYELFERAALPAIIKYVEPYAERARVAREMEKQANNECVQQTLGI